MLPAARVRRFWTAEIVALSIAAAFALALPSLALTYTGSNSRTLVEEDGNGVLALTAVPLVIVMIVAITLAVRGIRRAAGQLAWALVVVLGIIAVPSMLTVGPMIFPVFGALAVTCAIRSGRAGS